MTRDAARTELGHAGNKKISGEDQPEARGVVETSGQQGAGRASSVKEPPSMTKPRRQKTKNLGTHCNLRLGQAEEDAVTAMRTALAQVRGVDVKAVPFSQALRLLITENEKAARVLAGQPEAWTAPGTAEIPDEIWEGLTECRNRLSHSQGSLYGILRKLNFNEGPVTRDEFRAAFEAVRDSKSAVARMEDRLLRFVEDDPSAAAAQDGPEVA